MDSSTAPCYSPVLETLAYEEVIAQFPPVEDEEINKHRLLNEEAERNKASNNGDSPDSFYLKRLKLKLEKKLLREKELKMKRRLEMLQKQRMMQMKPRLVENKDEFFVYKPTLAPLPPALPSNSKILENKHVKTVLGFRYSQAVEEYYRKQLNHLGKLRLEPLSAIDYQAETVNGCSMINMGAGVLNMQARTLPSCNPLAIRLRKQQTLTRSREKESPNIFSIHKTFSRETVVSKVLTRSHGSLARLEANQPH